MPLGCDRSLLPLLLKIERGSTPGKCYRSPKENCQRRSSQFTGIVEIHQSSLFDPADGARNLAIAVMALKSRWRLRHAVPIWVPAAAALVLAIAPFSLCRINEGLSAKPYPVSLQGVRGLAVEAEAPPGKLLHLNLDLISLPQSDTYKIQIVNGDGDTSLAKSRPGSRRGGQYEHRRPSARRLLRARVRDVRRITQGVCAPPDREALITYPGVEVACSCYAA